MRKTIFVDCFNTVICRHVSAEEVLLNWCVELGGKYFIESVVLYHLFHKIKSKIAISNQFKIREPEARFDDILMKICETLEKHIKDFNIDEFKQSALELYVKAEMQSHYLNQELVVNLRELKSKGAKLYILSEFYCGKEVLRRLLENVGAADIFDDIYVSCDYMKSKRSRRLYKFVIKQLSLKKKDIVMYGDNYYPDIFAARLVGLKAIQVHTKIPKPTKNFKKLIKFGPNYNSFEKIFNEFGDKYNISNYAFPLYLFTKRLYSKLDEKGVENVFFLSREGWFLKKLFDNYCSLNNSGKNIKTHYLQVSRNSIYRANLKTLSEQNFSSLIKRTYKMSISVFLSSLDFSTGEIATVQKEINSNINKKYYRLEKKKIFKLLLNCKDFKEIYETKRAGQNEAFDAYIKSFGVDIATEGLHIVDIGWRGTMQNFITEFFDNKISVHGYYLALTKFMFDRNHKSVNVKNAEKNKIGILHQRGKHLQLGNKILKPVLTDYEQVLRANHNRVECYNVKDGNATVNYANSPPDEKKLHSECIYPLQIQIEEKFNKLSQFEVRHLSLFEPIAIKMFYKMIKKTSAHDLRFLFYAQESHFDEFGRVGFEKRDKNRSLKWFGKKIMYKTVNLIFLVRFRRTAKKINKMYLRSLRHKSN